MFMQRFLKAGGWLLPALLSLPGLAGGPDTCSPDRTDAKQVLWGDLHVHTGYSLDAYAFGLRLQPADAFRFAKGEAVPLMNSDRRIRLDRPLDFAAVTDHAESFDVMHACTLAETPSELPYCQQLRNTSQPESGWQVFRRFLLPLITPEQPQMAPICGKNGVDCDAARRSVWQQTQIQANAANEPCHFTALIGQEWSATPDSKHWHRNLIYASDKVPDDVFDYLRYPVLEDMWRALDRHCLPEQGCKVIAIPHNSNYEGSGSFNVEDSSPESRRLRAHYERLIEVFQSKGSSECLPLSWQDENPDCSFEIIIPRPTQQELEHSNTDQREAIWQQLRAGYARSLLGRGLQAYTENGEALNPLQLGLIGSTDSHSALAGSVTEERWHGDAWSSDGGAPKRLNEVLDYNPGGLVAVWAPRNTRPAIFDALQRREAYGTSGPRITLRLAATTASEPASCAAIENWRQHIPMGGSLPANASALNITVAAQADRHKLQTIEVIKGEVRGNQLYQQVIPIWHAEAGAMQTCAVWSDARFDPAAAAYWYVRVQEVASPRWSKIDCAATGQCDRYPKADRDIHERAWSSPIWHLPTSTASQ